MNILSVVGARPNFMKVAPIIRALRQHPYAFEHVLVHTGQHYDGRMSDRFFRDLDIPDPDFNLGVGSGSHAQQTAAVLTGIEPILQQLRPDLVLVVGDVNSTVAAALAAKKLDLRVAHVEAGLRSFDRTMPEEINRLCTDAISDLLFTTDRIADRQLEQEGVDPSRIHFVGNVMIDTLLAQLNQAEALAFHIELGLEPQAYAVLTLHRQSNVENPNKLGEILEAVVAAAADLPVIFPIHPRTRARLEALGGHDRWTRQRPGVAGLVLMEPLGYREFLSLNRFARVVFTDSGGVQEETTVLGVPCVTLRDNTERPITVSEGTNHLAGSTRAGILAAAHAALAIDTKTPRRPELWDGLASDRIAQILATLD